MDFLGVHPGHSNSNINYGFEKLIADNLVNVAMLIETPPYIVLEF
jgi:hypothetical protein